MSLLIINTTDVSEHILTDGYSVNTENKYEQWQDANGGYHRVLVRRRITGTINLKFKTESAYNSFVSLLKNVQRVDGSILCTVYVNNSAQSEAGYFYYTLSSTMHKSLDSGKRFKTVQMKIEEC